MVFKHLWGWVPEVPIGVFRRRVDRVLFLTTDIAKWLRPGTQAGKLAPFNIPPGPKSRQVLDQAKKAVADAEPGEALRVLSGLKLPALGAEIDLLSSRLVDYQRTRIHTTQAPDSESRTFNKISRDTRDLIVILEKELASSTGNYDTICAYLKKRYTNRLDQKLAKRQPVNLRRIPSTEGTSPERVATFVAYNSEEIGGTMAQIFREGRSRLLLLGEPGAGKTTLMLQLVLELLESEPAFMPVLLNLATWDSSFINLDAWLKKILSAELGVSERLTSEIIQQNRLILLLDGFDEIKKRNRVSCLEAIGRYGEDGQRKYAISSRKEEYFLVAKDAPVESQIEVGPLSIQQLETELQRLWSDPVNPERGARMLWNAIQENELLRTVVETPFYFNALQILFSGSKTLSELQLTTDSVEGLQAQITERFVEYELEGARAQYAPEQSSHWLSFLASRMNERNMVVFELRDLQYDWWKGWTRLELGLGGLGAGLSFSLLPSFSGGLLLGHTFGLTARHFAEPALGPFYGFLVWLFVGLYMFLYFGLFSIMFLGILSTLYHGLFKTNPIITTTEVINSSGVVFIQLIKKKFFIWLIAGFLVGQYFFTYNNIFFFVLFALTFWMFRGMFDLKDATNFIQIPSPFHRFNTSMKNLHFSNFQHKLLCHQLRKKNLLPPDLVEFLNEMSRHHLLEFDGNLTTGTGGGSWRFRHRILQEYFAGRWVEPEPQPTP